MSAPPLPDPRRADPVPVAGGGDIQNVAGVGFVIAALYFGRDIFVPMALAILLSFVLAPIISWLRRRRFPRTPAVITVVLLAFLAIFGFGVVVAGQISQLGNNLPQYQSNIQEKIRSLRSTATSGGVIAHASEMLRNLSQELDGPSDAPAAIASAGKPAEGAAPAAAGRAAPQRQPIPVQIQQPDPAPLQMLQSIVGPLIAPLATGGVVVVFVIFMLLQREDLRDRFIRLAGAGDLHRTTEALSDAGKRVAKYLLMQLVVNATYGVPIGLGLWAIGVPNPLLWGMLAMVLRFVPYIGPFIAALFPLALSIAVDPGWTMLIWTASLFVVIELLSNNVVEPWLYGSSTGLSPVAIIVAAIFWTWLWGPVGLLLSTPLTVCLVVLGQHVPRFAFLDVLLGSEPVLTLPERLYQRLLVGDPDEATERAEEFLEERPLLAFYDEVAIPALTLVEQDRARGVLEERRRAVVAAGALTLVDNLSGHEDETGAASSEDPEAGAEPPEVPHGLADLRPEWAGPSILSAGGRGNLDDVAAVMLTQLLGRAALGARPAPFDALASATYAGLDLAGIRLICLSYMNTESIAHARYLVRRLRRRTDVPILVGFWSMPAEEAARRDLVKATRADFAVTSLAGAIEVIEGLAYREAVSSASASPAPAPFADPGRPEPAAAGLFDHGAQPLPA